MSLGNETAAMMSYRDVVRVGEERVKQAALNVNGDSVLCQYCPVLSKVSVIYHHTKDMLCYSLTVCVCYCGMRGLEMLAYGVVEIERVQDYIFISDGDLYVK